MKILGSDDKLILVKLITKPSMELEAVKMIFIDLFCNFND